MCGRFTVLTYDEVLDVVESINMPAARTVFPDWPAVRPDGSRPEDIRPGGSSWLIGANEVGLTTQQALWGFRLQTTGQLAFNTRIETALSGRGAWGDLLETGRCIVPARCFFEPHVTELTVGPDGKKTKRQYRFESPEWPFVLMAGLVRDGRFSIVTTEPGEAVAPIHHRSPLVLGVAEARAWLGDEYLGFAGACAAPLVAEPEDPGDMYQASLF